MSEHQHDLDEQGYGEVGIVDEIYSPGYNHYICGVSISCINEDNQITTVELSPAQALSLLAWLKAEQAFLERLAKEQQP